MFILRAGADVDIFDPVIFEQYRSQDGPSIDKYGGKFIVRGGAAEKVIYYTDIRSKNKFSWCRYDDME